MRFPVRHLAPLALVAGLALVGAAPEPTASEVARSAGQVVTMVCASPLFLFASPTSVPRRSIAGGAGVGQRFTVLKGPRTTNEGINYIQIDVAAVEADFPNAHYWVLRDCASPTIR